MNTTTMSRPQAAGKHPTLRIVLARARMTLREGPGEPMLEGLAHSIETALLALRRPARFETDAHELRIAESPATYDNQAVLQEMLRLAMECAGAGHREAAEGIIGWLRKALVDTRVVELVWSLILRMSDPDDPRARLPQPRTGADSVDRIIAAVSSFPNDPTGALEALRRIYRNQTTPGADLKGLINSLEQLVPSRK
ncbi:MAG: hypothetical protein ACK5PW_22285 [Burkholderiales bacterium]